PRRRWTSSRCPAFRASCACRNVNQPSPSIVFPLAVVSRPWLIGLIGPIGPMGHVELPTASIINRRRPARSFPNRSRGPCPHTGHRPSPEVRPCHAIDIGVEALAGTPPEGSTPLLSSLVAAEARPRHARD